MKTEQLFKKLLYSIAFLTTMFTFAQSFTYNGIKYNITNTINNTVEVSYSSNVYYGNINIPNTVQNNGVTYTVTSIGDSAFDTSNITSITIPNSVTSIGNFAFYNCSILISITIPNSVTFIGNSAFYNCNTLTSITIPNSVTSIGESAFYNCINLTSIILPNSIKSIARNSFEGCSSLTSIILPNSLTSIGDNSFLFSGLKTITIPNSVTNIGYYAFGYCISLNTLTVNWQTPLNIDSSVFANVNLANVNLKVPDGTVALYQAAPVWKNFKSITLSTYEDALKPTVSFSPNPVKDVLHFSEILVKISVFDSAGKQIRYFENSSEINLSSLPKGFYIIKAFDKSGNRLSKKFIKD